MKNRLLCILMLLATAILNAQNKMDIERVYEDIVISKTETPKFQIDLKKYKTYRVFTLQKGIIVDLSIKSQNGNQVEAKVTTSKQSGTFERLEFTPKQDRTIILGIKRFEHEHNPESGKVSLKIEAIAEEQLKAEIKIAEIVATENEKVVQTLDIDHFWKAFDALENSKTRFDSIKIIQEQYLDRATSGLKDFMVERDFTSQGFIEVIAAYPKFYNSIREATFESKKTAPIVEEIVNKFKSIYPNFKDKKVNFSIGMFNTGGTISDDFLLIGTEISASTETTDLSELGGGAFADVLSNGKDIKTKIKNIVAHEYVHTQQKWEFANDAVQCNLLYYTIMEGSCDFIGELLSDGQINVVAQTYGDAQEAELWKSFKNELCNESSDNWLYNFQTVEEGVPADLGYYIGYKIAKAYYDNAEDKTQAIVDIIEMDRPLDFLRKSKYDLQFREE